MIIKKCVLGLLCSLAVVNPVIAAVWYDVDSTQIQFIRADSRQGLQGFYIQFTQPFPGDVGCSARDFAYIRVNEPLAKEMYATALAAFSAGEKITIGTTGCDSVGNVVQALAIKKN